MNRSKTARTTGVAGILAATLALSVALAQQGQLRPEDYAAIESSFRAAKRLEASQEFAKAADEYQSILDSYPTAVPRVYQNLGVVRYYQRQYAEAIDAFKRGLKLEPAMVGSRLFLGICYLNIEQPDKALPLLEAAHAAQPSFESASSLGQAYLGNLRYVNAIEALLEALPVAGEDTPSVLHSLGQAHLRQAERLVNEQAERHPESKDTYLAAAKLFESQQVYQIAAIKYLEAAELDPLNASIFFPLARMLAILGLEVPSQLALERYWALLPSVPKIPIDASMLPKEQVAEIGTKVDFEGILRGLPPVVKSGLPPLPVVPVDINVAIELHLRGPHSAAWKPAVGALASGQFKNALSALDAIPDAEVAWLREYLRASTYVWLDDYKRAAEVAAGSALAAESSEAVQMLRAEIFRQMSIEYFDRLVRDYPESCRARLVKAMNFAAQEKAEAESEFLAAIDACPLDTEIRIELASFCSITTCKKCIVKDETGATVLHIYSRHQSFEASN